MINTFPKQNQIPFIQTNRSNNIGSLWSTLNIDLQDNLGRVRLAQKLVINTSKTNEANLGLPVAFEFAFGDWWSICGDRVFHNDNSASTHSFDEDASTGFSTAFDTYSDLAVFDGALWACNGSVLLRKTTSGGNWSDETGSANLNGETQKMAYLKEFNRLYFVEGETEIGSIDVDENMALSGDYYIDLGNSTSEITTIVASSKEIWIGMGKNTSGGADGTQGEILRWDGISAQASNSYKIDASGIMAMLIYKEVPYAVDSYGRILQFTGSGFEEIQRLPLIGNMLINAAQSSQSQGRFVHQNGFTATKNNTFLINVNNQNDDSGDTVNENLPSGVWELDLTTRNLTHKHAFTLKERTATTTTDYGQNKLESVGAIKQVTLSDDDNDGFSTFLAGATVFSDNTTELPAIYNNFPYKFSPLGSDDRELQKRGYFVTTWYNSNQIANKWSRIYDIHRRFLTDTDKIIYKYRLVEEAPLSDVAITWTSTTTFTTTVDITAYDPANFPVSVGGEVEILKGTGSGACTHITNISLDGGTYTVTLDNAILNVTGTATARFQKWIKMSPEVTGQIKSWEEMAINSSNTQIQIKVVLEFTGDNEFHKFALSSNEEITINL